MGWGMTAREFAKGTPCFAMVRQVFYDMPEVLTREEHADLQGELMRLHAENTRDKQFVPRILSRGTMTRIADHIRTTKRNKGTTGSLEPGSLEPGSLEPGSLDAGRSDSNNDDSGCVSSAPSVDACAPSVDACTPGVDACTPSMDGSILPRAGKDASVALAPVTFDSNTLFQLSAAGDQLQLPKLTTVMLSSAACLLHTDPGYKVSPLVVQAAGEVLQALLNQVSPL